MTPKTPEQIFRFAPSPNGFLHIGHAYSALFNWDMARKTNGKLLLRFEDIDDQRCSKEFETEILKDLEWLEVEWSGEIRRQSDHYDDYEIVLNQLDQLGVLYPSFLSRSKVQDALRTIPASWPSDPDGVPHYPGDEREWSKEKIKEAMATHERYSRRLDIKKANNNISEKILWLEKEKRVEADPLLWGDVVLGRSDCPASYNLCVVIDDAATGITNIVRGEDLYEATSVHILLQKLLGLPSPIYHHHRLICDDTGRKLSKSEGDVALSHWRKKGMSVQDIREHLGLEI